MGRILGCIGLAAVILFSHSGFAEERFLVEELGDPALIDIEGAASFPAAEIRTALSGDFDFLLGSYPVSSLQPLLEVIRQKVALGYQQGGFPTPEVNARWDADRKRIVTTVVEGKRFRTGRVEVTGAKQLDAAALAEWAVRPQTPAGAPPQPGSGAPAQPPAIWKADDFATFARPSWKMIAAQLQPAFAEQGFFFPDFQVEVRPEPAGDKATLVIAIRDEGPRGTIGRIDIQGAEKHRPDQIQQLLGLTPGMAFHQDLLRQSEERLRASGRFLHESVTVIRPAKREDPLTLQIKVREYEDVPLLGAELSPEEQVVLKLGEKLSSFPHDHEDLVITEQFAHFPDKLDVSPRLALKLVLGAEHGLLLDARLTDPAGKPLWAQSLIYSSSKIALISPTRRCKFVCDPRKVGVATFRPTVKIEMTGTEKPLQEGKKFNSVWGIGFDSRDSVPVSPSIISARVAPVAALSWVHEKGWEYRLDDKTLSGSHGPSHLKVDRETGRLLAYEVHEPERAHHRVVKFEAGAQRRTVEEWDKLSAGYANGFNPAGPFSSLSDYVLSEAVELHAVLSPGRSREVLPTLRKLLNRSLAAAFDRLLLRAAAPRKTPAFSIPLSIPAAPAPLEPYVRWILPHYIPLFPRDSWPWVLGRECGFVLAGRGERAPAELERMATSHYTGPIGHLCAATAFGYINPRVAQYFAQTGLGKLELRHFRRDYGLLLQDDCRLGGLVLPVVDALRELDADEIHLLTEALLREADRPAIEQALLSLAAAKDRDMSDALPKVLDQLWTNLLQRQVKQRLEVLSDMGAVRSASR